MSKWKPDREREMQCLVCGKSGASACQGCKKAAYCGTLCQTTDWDARHRLICNGPDQNLESDGLMRIAGNEDQNDSKEDIPPGGGGGAETFTRVTVTASGHAIEVADRVSVSLSAETRSSSLEESGPELMARHRARIRNLEYLLSGYTARDVNIRLSDVRDKDYVRVIGRAATSYWVIELTDINKRYDTVKLSTTLLKTAPEYKDFIASVVAAGAMVSNVSMYLSRRASSEASKRAIRNAITTTRELANEIAETMRGSVERTIKLDVDAGRVSHGGVRYASQSSERAISASGGGGGGRREEADIPGQLEEIERVESVTMVFAVSEGSAVDRKYKQPKK